MKEAKHHYIPVFYLRQWADREGRLCEFSRPHKVVKPRMTYPDGTGYVRGLYTFEKLSEIIRNSLEKEFLLRTDNMASVALRRLLARQTEMDIDLKSAWSRFIMTLLYRNPESIHRLVKQVAVGLPSVVRELRTDYELRCGAGDSQTFEEFAGTVRRSDLQLTTLRVLQSMMDSENVGALLNTMAWDVITFERPRYPLLISDRPYVMTNGLNGPHGHLILPISPNTIFIAARTEETMRRLKVLCQSSDARMNEKLNDRVARQSHKFVWAMSDDQLGFVRSRLGQKVPSMPHG